MLKPLITIRSVDFGEEQNDADPVDGGGPKLLGLGYEEYVRRKRRRPRTFRTGLGRLFAGVKAADEGAAGSREWLAGFTGERGDTRTTRKTLFFQPDEHG